MISTAIMITLCSITQFVTPPNYVWTDRDHQTLIKARETCPARFPASPCVARFEIKSNDHYNVTCGRIK